MPAVNQRRSRLPALAVLPLVAVVALTLAAEPSGAAPRDLTGRWGVGLEAGMIKLTGGDRDFSNLDQFTGLAVSRGFARVWSLQLALRYGYIRPGVGTPYEDDVGWSTKTGAPFYTTLIQPLVRLRYHIELSSGITPYLGAGGGLTSWKSMDKTGQSVGWFPSGPAAQGYDTSGNRAELKGTAATFGFELGVDIALGRSWAASVGGRLHLMPGIKKDNVGVSALWGPDHVDANTSSGEFFLGVTRWFGNNDKDGDGLANGDDSCPDRAEDIDGFQDDDGCPDPDNDRDGIPDADDACPDEPEDDDGYQDDDGCPEPDNDGDGVIDSRDGCPEEAEDQDGFQDDDGCPDPDNDGDGVVDALDRCPDTPPAANVDEDGCLDSPVIVPLVSSVLPIPGQTIVLAGVSFPPGQAQVTGASHAVLDELAQAMKANPEAILEIRGHTDAAGDAAANLDLSERRAVAIRDELIRRGVATDRVSAVGYGEDFPIADNETREGRARNRRVELLRVE